MPPHGPSRLDLALMAGLSKHVAVLPVVGKADTMTTDEADTCRQAVQHMLAEPAECVPGFKAGDTFDVYRWLSVPEMLPLSRPVLECSSTSTHAFSVEQVELTGQAVSAAKPISAYNKWHQAGSLFYPA
eukprot:GHRQ01026979.1.p1 GENE.GHRQ01026979.1~~GHRQ01026979.1.p1  ORF type:complete len:129 (-),score=41.34 GHRQ01026979.1:6-392(-)